MSSFLKESVTSYPESNSNIVTETASPPYSGQDFISGPSEYQQGRPAERDSHWLLIRNRQQVYFSYTHAYMERRARELAIIIVVAAEISQENDVTDPPSTYSTRHSLISKNPLSKERFRGNFDPWESILRMGFRLLPSYGTTEPQMGNDAQEYSPVTSATAEGARRRGRRGTKTKQPGYQSPIRRRKVGLAVLVDPNIRAELHEIAHARGTSTNKMLEEIAVALVEEYKARSSLKISLPKAFKKDRAIIKKAAQQLAYAIRSCVK